MIKIISHRKHCEEVLYERNFSNKDGRGGYGFPCDKDGNLIENLAPAGAANYEGCITGALDVVDNGVISWTHRWIEPAIGKCHCGRKVVLDGFTNTCEKCGRDYNSSGQELAPRSYWGEETGEHISDILRIK